MLDKKLQLAAFLNHGENRSKHAVAVGHWINKQALNKP